MLIHLRSHNQAIVSTYFVLAAFGVLAMPAFAQDADPSDIKAQPKDGRDHAAPLSERMPPNVSTLPLFGRIEWRTTKLPWVGDGPYEGISGAGMTRVGDHLYVVGGFIPGGDETNGASRGTSRWTWRFDTGDETWERLSDAPFRREYVRATRLDNRVYVMGGGCQYKDHDPPYRPHDETAALDLSGASPEWQTLPPLSVPRTHMAVGATGPYVIVAGGNEYQWSERGYSHKTIRGTVEVLDTHDADAG